MKKMILGVLGLTAVCMASSVHAQELQFEAVPQQSPIQATKFRGQMGQELQFRGQDSDATGSEFGTGVQRANFTRASKTTLPRFTELPREPQVQTPPRLTESPAGGPLVQEVPMPRKVTPRIIPTPQDIPMEDSELIPPSEDNVQGPLFYPQGPVSQAPFPSAQTMPPGPPGTPGVIGPDWSGTEEVVCEGGGCPEESSFGFGDWGAGHGWLTGWQHGCGKLLGGCCGPRGDCRPTFYVNGEYLLWWIDDPDLPPLVTGTTVSPEVIAGIIQRPGALGELGTNLLFGGGQGIDSPTFHGGRFTIGFGLPRHLKGIEATFFFLGKQSINFSAASDATGQPGIYRPFFDPVQNEESALAVAFPLLSTGRIDIQHVTDIWGGEFNFRKNLICGCKHQLDLLAGFRFLEISESLNIRQSSIGLVNIPPNFIADNITTIDESFAARNRFYGGQVGLDWTMRHGCWFVGVTSKLAVGAMHQNVTIGGNTFTQPAGGVPIPSTGGLLARPSNIGTYNRDRFAVIPEVGVKLGYQFTDHLSAYVAYNLLYVSSVARPGDQIDRTVNLTAVPGFPQGAVGPTRPLFIFQDTSFWAQGWSVGLKWQF